MSGTIEPEDSGGVQPIVPPGPRYPEAPAAKVFRGVFGELVGALEPHTEADPVAILVQALAAFGNLLGRRPYFVADGTRHYTNLFAGQLVAASSKGRKGTAWSHVRNCLTAIDPRLAHRERLVERGGVIWHVRDAHYVEREIRRSGKSTGEREMVLDDAGVEDKRLFVAEPEFARVLRVGEREGATLSPVLREAWDSGTLSSLTKNCPAKATNAHVSVIGHITAEELRRYLTATEAGNGFGNRFLWLCARRSKYLPDGGNPDATALASISNDFRSAIAQAHDRGEIRRDPAASARWRAVYHDLSDGRPGLLGSMTGRAEAQVMRLACLYALAMPPPTLASTTSKPRSPCGAIALIQPVHLWRLAGQPNRRRFLGGVADCGRRRADARRDVEGPVRPQSVRSTDCPGAGPATRTRPRARRSGSVGHWATRGTLVRVPYELNDIRGLVRLIRCYRDGTDSHQCPKRLQRTPRPQTANRSR